MYKVPFFVKLASSGTSFFDPASGLSVFGEHVGEVKVLTPQVKQWLQQGGLVPCTPEGELLGFSVVKTSTQKPAEEEETTPPPADEEESTSDEDSDEDSEQSEGEQDEEHDEEQEDEQEPGLDALLGATDKELAKTGSKSKKHRR